MEQKAQGAIEYLLIIGAAILVVAIVIVAMTGIVGTGQQTGTSATGDYNSQLGDLNSLKQ
ncbi:MAG: class III signal peptide-containing protein [archaeon]